MSDLRRRLNSMEKLWPPPAPPATPARTPDWSQLTEEDRETYAEIRIAMSAVDVGPARVDERTELRMRLAALTDDQLDRLQALSEKIGRL